jgi:hypothetical protein
MKYNERISCKIVETAWRKPKRGFIRAILLPCITSVLLVVTDYLTIAFAQFEIVMFGRRDK